MPEDDVSDLRDVVDAINKLCETMKTSYDEYEDCEDNSRPETIEPTTSQYINAVAEHVILEPETEKDRYAELDPEPTITQPIYEETPITDRWSDTVDEPDVSTFERCVTDCWSDRIITPVVFTSEYATVPRVVPTAINDIEVIRDIVVEKRDRVVEEIELVASDVEFAAEQAPCEPTSEMYYTASSEVSLLSDIDMQEKAQSEDSDKEKDDRNSVIAGHVAAMRERFESMTRTNTPCPDLMRSTSPSFEVFRNISASPDHLG